MEFGVEIKSVNDYLIQKSSEEREKITEIRNIVSKAVPGVEESYNRQMIVFNYLYQLVGASIKKNYLCFHTLNNKMIRRFAPRLKGYKISGSIIYFPLTEPLPEDLIRDIIHAREKENLLKEELKRKL
jgi:uncharacterized protein YdhG (YjbR/CyaY superfamily)